MNFAEMWSPGAAADAALDVMAAGTDEIPNGVWRDIGFRLESMGWLMPL
jgi:hypothetical protein